MTLSSSYYCSKTKTDLSTIFAKYQDFFPLTLNFVTDLGLELLVLPGEPGQPLPDGGRDVLQHTTVRLLSQLSTVLGASLSNLTSTNRYLVFKNFSIAMVSSNSDRIH
jgi:hypothetical protein